MNRRLFLQMAAAAAAVAAAPVWAADAPITFEVERLAPDRLSLQWNGFAAPARLFASSDPAATPELMRSLDAARRAHSVNVALAVSPRPYFLIEGADGARLRAAERILPLEGGVNFRDLGGYRSEDGRHVRWGLLYRSGVMHGLSLSDYDYLRHLGIETVCDFRSVQERQQEPTNWTGPNPPEILAADYDMGALRPNLNATDAEGARTAFAALYTQLPTHLAPQYREMFQRLVRREAPLAFHCSAGKDRTGMAAALILSVLGVPRETILADYALSERYYRPAASAAQAGGSRLGNLSPEAARIVAGADPIVLERALAAIDAQYGGPRALVQALYGLSDGEIDVLRQAYLE